MKNGEIKINKNSGGYKYFYGKALDSFNSWADKYYTQRLTNEGKGWCVIKNGKVWRDGFKSESFCWRSIVTQLFISCNIWDFGNKFQSDRHLSGLECYSEKELNLVKSYMEKVCEEMGMKLKSKFECFKDGSLLLFAGIEEDKYLKHEIAKDLGFWVEYRG